MIDVTVKVPQERLADFYAMFGAWLAGADHEQMDSAPTSEVSAWQNTDEDFVLAQVVWEKFSDRAKSLYSTLMDSPEQRFSGEDLAEALHIPNGKYGVAGVLAWPGRHCAAVGRPLPSRDEEGAVGASSSYWMTKEVASLFRKVRG